MYYTFLDNFIKEKERSNNKKSLSSVPLLLVFILFCLLSKLNPLFYQLAQLFVFQLLYSNLMVYPIMKAKPANYTIYTEN